MIEREERERNRRTRCEFLTVINNKKSINELQNLNTCSSHSCQIHCYIYRFQHNTNSLATVLQTAN